MKFEREELEPPIKWRPRLRSMFTAKQDLRVQTSLDLRGERYEQSPHRLRYHFDAASLSNHPMVVYYSA